MRLPSIRNPRSFYDVFSIVILGVVVMAAILSVWHGSFVRLEMAAFMGAVFLWAAWAFDRILKHQTERRKRQYRGRVK